MMKGLYFVLLMLFAAGSAKAQSPYFGISFSTDDTVKAAIEIYKKPLPQGDVFEHVMSEIDFHNLPDTIKQSYKYSLCEDCFEIRNGNYSFSNQDMIFEYIYNLILVNNAGDTMNVTVPIREKSFVTFLKFGKLKFKKGNYEPWDKAEHKYINGHLNIILPPQEEW